MDLGVKPFTALTWEATLSYPKILVKISPVFTLVSMIGFIVGLSKKDKLVLLSATWAVCWYLFFSFCVGYLNIEKYLVTFIPALIVPFAIGCDAIVQRIKAKLKIKHAAISTGDNMFLVLVLRSCQFTMFMVAGSWQICCGKSKRKIRPILRQL
jgi:hypothetical protein